MRRATAHRIACVILFVAIVAPLAKADSAVDLISGFDVDRVATTYPPTDDESTGELAKLIYRLQTVDDKTLQSRVQSGEATAVADAVRYEGKVSAISVVNVPAKLVEFLELETLHQLEIVTDRGNVDLIAGHINPALKVGDRVSGLGISIGIDDSRTIAIAAATLAWFPKSVPTIGWQLLRDANVDVGLIAELPSRSRRPLQAEDADAFYAFLSAAKQIAERIETPAPKRVRPIDTLQKAKTLSGQWVRLELETVQITRVFVTDADRIAEIGSDHYFQIDAVGDLENVIVKVEPTNAHDQPAIFDGRYPVSVVALHLPDFLRHQVAEQAGDDAVVAQVRTKIAANGFFFRLWSYETDFMNQHGSANQFGPLVIAATIVDREGPATAVPGLSLISTIAALAVSIGILTIFLWHRRTSAHDDELRQRRQDRESKQIDFPTS